VTVNPDGTLTYTINVFARGTETFTYTVSDGSGATATATVTLTVCVPPAVGIDMLIDQVGRLDLTSGEKNALTSKLGAARQSLARGNDQAAVNQLGAFINEVQALRRTGRLGPATADLLIGQAQAIIDAILNPEC